MKDYFIHYEIRDLGNTVIVVEHDEEAILIADHVIDIGPGAGINGGEIIAQGTPKKLKKKRKHNSINLQEPTKFMFLNTGEK